VPELPPRPNPPRSVRESARAWVDWFGITRLFASAAAVVVVVGGAWLLVRTPPPAAEATLPVTSGSVPSSTLAVPTTVVAIDASVFVVHVAGAVSAPGVYDVRGPARVIDAIDAAGGPAPEAELDSLNLAAPLVDGQRVYVPVVGEIVAPASDGSALADPSASGPIDLNTTNAAELEQLPGVGPATATAIIEHRDEHGPFASVDDLTDVRGIGPAKLEAIRDLVRV
jgi:competence protein ComEA